VSDRGYLRAAMRGALTGWVLGLSACAPAPTIRTDHGNTVDFSNFVGAIDAGSAHIGLRTIVRP